MSAYVTEEKNITIMLASGEVLNLENALVLHSVTTWKHVHAFIQDYCRFVWDTNAREMRKIAALGVDDVVGGIA